MELKLSPGQVALTRCDVNTGHVLKTDGSLYFQNGDIHEIFESLAVAERFIETTLAIRLDIEFVVYGHKGDPILIWNRFERKRLN